MTNPISKNVLAILVLAQLAATNSKLSAKETQSAVSPSSAATKPSTQPKEELEKQVRKPLFVFLNDSGCTAWSTAIGESVEKVKPIYEQRVDFVEMDVQRKDEMREKAKRYGISGWMADVGELVPLVMIFPSSRRSPREFPGPNSLEVYEQALDQILLQEKNNQ